MWGGKYIHFYIFRPLKIYIQRSFSKCTPLYLQKKKWQQLTVYSMNPLSYSTQSYRKLKNQRHNQTFSAKNYGFKGISRIKNQAQTILDIYLKGPFLSQFGIYQAFYRAIWWKVSFPDSIWYVLGLLSRGFRYTIYKNIQNLFFCEKCRKFAKILYFVFYGFCYYIVCLNIYKDINLYELYSR